MGERRMAKKNILIVDDEQELVLAVKIRLESEGFEVQAAGDGQAALNQVASHRPDLIILDIRMPVMDGYSCLREMNNRYGRGELAVIILTARDQMKDLFELEGIEDYVVKPFDHDDLITRINMAFQRRAQGKKPT